MSLLNDSEVDFIDITKEHIQSYIESNAVFDWVLKCTKNRINKTNFEIKFVDFVPCIQNKMLKLSTNITSDYSPDKTKRGKQTIELPSLINTYDLSRSIVIGYDFLLPIVTELADHQKIDLSDWEQFNQLCIITVLIIIARANIERKFSAVIS